MEVVLDTTTNTQIVVCARARVCVTDGVAGRQGSGSSQDEIPVINIKPDDTSKHFIDSDVKHDKNVPDSISPPFS